MALYILNRTYTHRSTSGVVSFVKGEPSWVPPVMEKEVIAIGAERAEGQNPDVLLPEVAASAPLTPDERRQQLFVAFDLIAGRNDPKDFTGQGVPTIKAIEKVVDFDTDRTELTEAWGEYKISKVTEG